MKNIRSLLDDPAILLYEASGELEVQAVDFHKGDIAGAKQRRKAASSLIDEAMRLLERNIR